MRKPSIGTKRSERGLAIEARLIRKLNKIVSRAKVPLESTHDSEDMDKLLYQTEATDD